ncbi:cell envelope integrity protein TolA [Psychrobacter sp.]|uniref:cell envelope integrity protein TolA n=1 Tax=Psychrobacter sp. TaxID=56811 RepID=UPI0035663BBF
MDDTMSSYSFSHQFYQRWTCAPEPIRASIIQELTDITTLLKAETPFETFVFSTHDLDAHLDDLYENHEAEQAIAKAISDKQAHEQATAEQQRLEEEQKIKAVEEAKRKEESQLKEASKLKAAALIEENKHKETENARKEVEKETPLAAIEPDTTDTDKANTDSSVNAIINDKSDTEKNTIASKTISEHANAIDAENIKNDSTIKNDSSINAINNKASAAISLAVKDAKLSVTHKELIHELEMQIDDYLSDQMMLMSENLKSWLRAEMTQHLGEQDKTLTKNEVRKD